MNLRIAFSIIASVGSVGYAQDRPNIIYIMCDDMGYGDLGCYGQQLISTPNIDRMASEGMRFTQAYAGSPVSAPSRACFMTGQHSGHTHVRGNLEYWGRQNLQQDLYGENADYTCVGQEPYTTEHVIIPEIFKKEGYATALFGKWAGGYEGSRSVPEKRGIDQFYGYICQFQAHLYYPNFLNRYDPKHFGDTATVRVTLDENIRHPMSGSGYSERTQYSADLIHQEALKWLDEQTPKNHSSEYSHTQFPMPNYDSPKTVSTIITQTFSGTSTSSRGMPIADIMLQTMLMHSLQQ